MHLPVEEVSYSGMSLSEEYTVADDEKMIFLTLCARIASHRVIVEPRLLS